jgi:hypothetical protein
MITSEPTAPQTVTLAEALTTIELEDGKRPCNCSEGCPGTTTRFFSQGHDARMVTRLRNAVTAGELTLADAFAEITKRGGTERLQIKLDAAVANARKPRKARKAKAAKAIETFTLGGFTLASMPLATEPRVVAKVSRWEYLGEIVTYQIVEDGKPSKGDTALVFEYKDKKGEFHQATSYSRVKVDEEFDAVWADEPEVAAPEAAPIEVPAALAEVVGPRRTTNSGDAIPF